jgi:hypothetical protein
MRMVEYLILAGLAIGGYAGAPLWWVLPATAAMTVAGWWTKAGLLRQHPRVPFSTKMKTYLVVRHRPGRLPRDHLLHGGKVGAMDSGRLGSFCPSSIESQTTHSSSS